MFRPLILAATLAAGTAAAAPAFDPRVVPGGFGGAQATHLHGNDGEGGPVIHRPDPAAGSGVSAGMARIQGGGDEAAISRSGPARGSLGAARAPRIVGNDGGGPVLSGH
ncbi:hypothetical protein ACI6QG_10295 [Roseococcus sp. DSY-14]|uniref:hypothetical protein n=1 Tax=Roseococcus sp. DSY-14 TaxID=3369650 RepID=UPI00387B9C03